MCKGSAAAAPVARPPAGGGDATVSRRGEAGARVRRVEIKRGDAIDQIKFVYDDGSTCAHGHSGGKADARPCILTDGEYIVRVTHERFENYTCAAAAVELATNKGRVFAYHPQTMATRRRAEQTTATAAAGHEIVALTIRRGCLLAAEEQPVPPAERGRHPGEWYAVAEGGAGRGASFRHFHSAAAASAAWAGAARAARGAAGRGALLIDCTHLLVRRRAGDAGGAAACEAAAAGRGLCAAKPEGAVSMADAIATLFRVIGGRSDAALFALVTALLTASFYLELEASMLTGHVLATATAPADAAVLEEGWLVAAACRHAVGCDGSPAALRRALVAAFIVAKLAEKVLYVANVYLHHKGCSTKSRQMRIRAFDHVLSLDQAFFDTHTKSEIEGSMNVHSLSNLITWNIPYLFTLAVQSAMIMYFMMSINLELGALCLAGTLMIQYGILEPLCAVEQNVHRTQFKIDTMVRQIVDEALSMASSIKMFSKERHHSAEHRTSQRRYMQNINTVVILRCVREFGYGVSQVCVFGGLLYVGMNRAEIAAGDLTGFFLLLQKFQSIIGRVKWHYEVLVREFPDIERFLTLMRAEPAIADGTERPDDVRGEIEFKGVRFEYPSRPGEEVLKGLNLRVRANKITAIVGDSGAGKSTIAKLAMRLYDPKEGSVTLDGRDLRDLDLQYLHHQIAIVNQNPDLFNASLGENIGYGSTGASYTEEQVEAAGRLANCDFISRFRGGLDTFAGARGADLSGGQKQRLAIARAAIRDPRVLILDEATSSLDAKNEALVQEALERLMRGRTILIIAHRLSTIRSADEVVCMRDGEVVERGTHDELMRTGTAYRELVSKQIMG